MGMISADVLRLDYRPFVDVPKRAVPVYRRRPCVSELAPNGTPETMNAGMGDGSVRSLSCHLSGTIWCAVYAQWRRSGSVVGLLTRPGHEGCDMFRRLAWFPSWMLFAPGCGGRPMGDISGTVTFRGERLALGTITFINADGSVAQGNVEDGLYHIAKVPVGAVTIAVFAHPSPIPPSMLDQVRPLPAFRKKFVPIPKRDQNADQSGLTYTVVRGKQTHDVPLVP